MPAQQPKQVGNPRDSTARGVLGPVHQLHMQPYRLADHVGDDCGPAA